MQIQRAACASFILRAQKPLTATPCLSKGGGSFEFLCFCIFCVFVFQYTSFITRVEIQFQAFQGGYIFVFLCFCVFVFYSFTLVPATPGLSKRGWVAADSLLRMHFFFSKHFVSHGESFGVSFYGAFANDTAWFGKSGLNCWVRWQIM